MKVPSTEELILFLKTSEPHKLVLRALPIQIPLSGDSYMFSNISTFFKQYAFIDLERWGLIELQTSYRVREEGWSTSMTTAIAVPSWQITLTGEQYLAEIEDESTINGRIDTISEDKRTA
jgi:hypothetical protein